MEREAKINAWIFMGPVLAGFLIIFWGPLGVVPGIFLSWGVYKVISAKISLKSRSKDWIEWGIKNMTAAEKKRYLWGYSFIALGLISLLLVICKY